MQKESKLYLGDCLNVLPTLKNDTIDAMVTDPPYGLKFMNNKWDASVPSINIWRECLRVLKPGAFAFVMSSPRQDVLSRMICNISDAGFNTGFSSIYWAYNTGFLKAQNISKVLDKRAGAVQTIIGHYQAPDGANRKYSTHVNNPQNVYKMDKKTYNAEERPIRAPMTEDAKKLEGAYSGFQPKPAVEIVIVVMKPLSEKAYADQALMNGHGCTWLDNCKIPYESDAEIGVIESKMAKEKTPRTDFLNGGLKRPRGNLRKENGRFPANVLCQDNVPDDSGSFSRYFSLDAWFAKRIKILPKEAQKTFPWLIVPKASKAEKNLNVAVNPIDNSDAYNGKFPESKADKENKHKHPTMKPLKLMMWLITLGSREGDIILDPFMGSGTTPLAAKMTHRQYKGIERAEEFFDTAVLRVGEAQSNFDKFIYRM